MNIRRKKMALWKLCIIALGLCLPLRVRAEIAAPSEPVGNATDKAERERPFKLKKRMTPKERAHLLAHKKELEKKNAKRKPASPAKKKKDPAKP